MYYAVTSKSMKMIDDYAIEEIKIPSMVLMERAAYETVSHMKKDLHKRDRILAVCGPGNNGGDGIAAGRILYLQGYHVAILFLGDESKASKETKLQLTIAKNIGIPFVESHQIWDYDILIDAIFGVGLSRPVTGVYEAVIKNMNQGNQRIYSVDIPSGISADHGQVMNVAVKANVTITFGYAKIGMLLLPGAEYCGEIKVVDIGFPINGEQKAKLDTFYYGLEDLSLLPLRKKDSHKGSYGKVLVIAGSEGMSGAAYLAAKAAYRTGAGLVKVLTSSSNRLILQSTLPEALFEAYDAYGKSNDEWEKRIAENLSWASVIIIGPGLGQTAFTEKLLDFVLIEAKVPVIIDADGLNLLAKKMDRQALLGQERINFLSKLLKAHAILTPHPMELSRLLKRELSEISNNIIDTARECSYNNKLIYVMKDARTIVSRQGKLYINISGNNGMATGGSGDVLTGIIAGLYAQGMEAFEASCLGVYIHGLAGDIAASKHSNYSMLAGDIVDALGDVFRGESLNLMEDRVFDYYKPMGKQHLN